MSKKKVILTSIIVMVIMMFSIGIKVSFYEPSKINRVIEGKVFKTPANTAFKDDNFYKCVVDAYNEINSESLAYTTKLTDEQLLTITELSCSGNNKSDEEKIVNTTGLEKLTALTSLDVNSNKLTTLDVSQNTLLTSLYAYNNQLTSLDVSSNTSLKWLDVFSNQLTTIDVSKNTALIKLSLSNNKLTSLDVSKNTLMQILYVQNNQLTSLDVSKNTALKSLIITNNQFKEIMYGYKNTNINVNLLDIDLKLPSDKTIEAKSVSEGYSDLLNTNVISFKDAGEYDFSVNYEHNISSSNNTFSVNYNVKVIGLNSSKYIINEELNYIYTGIDTNNQTILNNVSVNFGEVSIENNKLLIKYNEEIIKTFNIVNISSEKYDLSKEYIYVGTNELEKESISVLNGDKVIENNKLLIKTGNSVLKSFNIVSISSTVYDLNKDYIYVGAGSLNLNNINVINGTKEISDNKLLIKTSNSVLKSFDILSISSTIYDLNKNYIYVGTNNFDFNNISVIGVTKEFKDNKLLIKKDNNVLKEFEIKNISFNKMETFSKIIKVSKKISYEDFTGNIILDKVFTYKIFNGDTEVTNGTITNGMVLKIYDKEDIIDIFNINAEYLDMNNVNIDDNKKQIKGFGLEKKISELKQNISTSGKVTITNPKGVLLGDNDKLTTGTKVKIELATETKEYTVVIKGDVTGTGEASVSDVAKLYQALKGKIEIEDCYKEAGNVYSVDNEIKINDIAKLYQFIKGKIKTLD